MGKCVLMVVFILQDILETETLKSFSLNVRNFTDEYKIASFVD